MALTLDRLKEMLKQEGLQFFVHASEPAVMFAGTGMNATYQFVITLANDGQFFQLRSVNYLRCPVQHPHLIDVLKVLAHVNYDKRLVKFAWSAADGEIVAYADAWLMDGTLTQSQLTRMLSNYLPVIDLSYPRIRAAMDTGKDPGEANPADVIGKMGGPGGLPEALRKLIEKVTSDKKKDKDKDKDGTKDTIESI